MIENKNVSIPIAIVGIGCKFPGDCNDKDSFWELLINKKSGITSYPKSRLHIDFFNESNMHDTIVTSSAGILSDIEYFDPLPFKINTQEAIEMDPQQRIVLEAAHQALDDSGLLYRNTNMGVYIGALGMISNPFNRHTTNEYSMTGREMAILANRINYVFDLKGPSIALDTACSSSLTSLHLAIQSILTGDCDTAIAGGSNMILDPEQAIAFSQLGVNSKTGKCHTFDASADGYIRSEGAGMIVLKRLKDAEKDNDHIYCVLLGTAINTCGRGPSLTYPGAEAQRNVLLKAFNKANRNVNNVTYAELHGTGTPLGDPIEANTVGKYLCLNRSLNIPPLIIGSTKANIGHLETASAIASIIKVCLMLERKITPPQIEFNKPNPKINWNEYKFQVFKEKQKLISCIPSEPPIVSIASFGFGGANGYAVMEGYEYKINNNFKDKNCKCNDELIIIGSNMNESIKVIIENLKKYNYKNKYLNLYSEQEIFSNLSYQLNRRSYNYEVISIGIFSNLNDLMTNNHFSEPILRIPRTLNPLLKIFVFSGQGPQHDLMGRQIFNRFKVFRNSILKSDLMYQNMNHGISFLDKYNLFHTFNENMKISKNLWPVEKTVIGIAMLQIALFDLWKSIGIIPDIIIGHSIGEVAVMYANGTLSHENTMKVAIARANAMTSLQKRTKETGIVGGMLALNSSIEIAMKLIDTVLRNNNKNEGLWIAAKNSLNALTIAGYDELIDQMVQYVELNCKDIVVRKLNVTSAYHTPLVQPCKEEYISQLNKIFNNENDNNKNKDFKPVIPTISTVTGGFYDSNYGSEYCWNNMRHEVQFKEGMDCINYELKNKGISLNDVYFIEISAHPVLRGYMEDMDFKNVITCMKRPRSQDKNPTSEIRNFFNAIKELFLYGETKIDLTSLYSIDVSHLSSLTISLPKYPYKKKNLWSESPESTIRRIGSNHLNEKKIKILNSLIDYLDIQKKEYSLSMKTIPWVEGHTIDNAILFPAAGYIEAAMSFGSRILKNIHFKRAFIIPEDKNKHIIATLKLNEYNNKEWSFSTNDTIHCYGTIEPTIVMRNPNDKIDKKSIDLKDIIKRCMIPVNTKAMYKRLHSKYQFKKDHGFQQLENILVSKDLQETICNINIPNEYNNNKHNYIIHPSTLDAIFQSILPLLYDIGNENDVRPLENIFLPKKVGKITRYDMIDNEEFINDHYKSKKQIQMKCIKKNNLIIYSQFLKWTPEAIIANCTLINNTNNMIVLKLENVVFSSINNNNNNKDENDKMKRYTSIWQPMEFLPTNLKEHEASNYLRKLDLEFIGKSGKEKGIEYMIESIISSIKLVHSINNKKVYRIMMISDSENINNYTNILNIFYEKVLMNSNDYFKNNNIFIHLTIAFPTEDLKLKFINNKNNTFIFKYPYLKFIRLYSNFVKDNDLNTTFDSCMDIYYDIIFGSLIQTMNSNSNKKIENAMNWIHKALVPNGLLLIENKFELINCNGETKEDQLNALLPYMKKQTCLFPSSYKNKKIQYIKNNNQWIIAGLKDSSIFKQKDNNDNNNKNNNTIIYNHYFTKDSEGKLADKVRQIENESRNVQLWIITEDTMELRGKILGLTRVIQNELIQCSVYCVLIHPNVYNNNDMKNKIIQVLQDSVYENTIEKEIRITADRKILYNRILPITNTLDKVDTNDLKTFLKTHELSHSWQLTNSNIISLTALPELGNEEVEISADCWMSENDINDKMNNNNEFYCFSGKVLKIGTNVTRVKSGEIVTGFVPKSSYYKNIILSKVIVLHEGLVSNIKNNTLMNISSYLPVWYSIVHRGNIIENINYIKDSNNIKIILITDLFSSTGYALYNILNTYCNKKFHIIGITNLNKNLNTNNKWYYNNNLFEKNDFVTIVTYTSPDQLEKEIQIVLNNKKSENIDFVFDNIKDNNYIDILMELLEPSSGCFISFKTERSTNYNQIQNSFKMEKTIININLNEIAMKKPYELSKALDTILIDNNNNNRLQYNILCQNNKQIYSKHLKSDDNYIYPFELENYLSNAVDNTFNIIKYFSPRKYYILIGGCGGLGPEMAFWLAKNGAKKIVLTSRRGKIDDTEENYKNLRIIKYLREILHVEIILAAVDASSTIETTSFINKLINNNIKNGIKNQIGGIMLMTMLLDDGPMRSMNQERFEKVYACKIKAVNILMDLFSSKNENMTSIFNHKPEFILLFSSISAMIGNPGQPNYSAAQSYFDELSKEYYNKTSDLKIISIHAPAISDAGYLEKDAKYGNYRIKQLLNLSKTVHYLGNMIKDALVNYKYGEYITQWDWNHLVDKFPCTSERINHLIEYKLDKNDNNINNNPIADPIGTLVTTILGLQDINEIESNIPLYQFGLDSITSTTLSKKLLSLYNVHVSQMQLLGHTTLDYLRELYQANLLDTISTENKNNELTNLNYNEFTGILLTGATGFLGSRVLVELLKDPKIVVYCIIRGNNPNQGKLRLKEALNNYGLLNSSNINMNISLKDLEERVFIVMGDIIKNTFIQNLNNLTKSKKCSVNHVIHCAATVDLVASNDTLISDNNKTVENLIEWCLPNNKSNDTKSFHFMSSTSVMLTGNDLLPEHTNISNKYSFSGYGLSKWHAEQYLTKIAKENPMFPIFIYRAPFLVSDIPGKAQTTNVATVIALLSKATNKIPNIKNGNFLPIMNLGFVAKTIARLCLYYNDNKNIKENLVSNSNEKNNNERIKVLNLMPNDLPSWNNMFKEMKKAGLSAEITTFEDWFMAIKETAKNKYTNTLGSIDVIEKITQQNICLLHLEKTQKELAKINLDINDVQYDSNSLKPLIDSVCNM